MIPANNTLQDLIAKLAERDWPSEADVQKREAWQQKSRTESNKIVYWDAFLKHLADDLRRQASKPPQESSGNKRALAQIEATGPGDNLFLYGRRGVGKTHLALWCAGRLVKAHGLAARFRTFPQLLEEFDLARQTGEAAPDSQHHDVLVIDDLDKGRTTTYASERVYELLTRLSSSHKTTIITCNRSPVEVAKRFYEGDWRNQEALASRFMTMNPLLVTGRDQRVAHAQEVA